MTDPEIYKEWAKGFSPNSQFIGEWKQGAQMKFLDPNMGGTKGLVEEVIPLQLIHIRHTAILNKDGSEDLNSAIAKTWIGTTETYSLRSDNGKTRLSIEIVTHPNYAKMFNRGWEKSLRLLKEICEKE